MTEFIIPSYLVQYKTFKQINCNGIGLILSTQYDIIFQNGGDVLQRSEYAKKLFLMGYNCSQSVLGAFHDVMEMSLDTALKLGSSFGGGIARMRQVCGTVSAIFMVAGLVRGYTANTVEAKSEHYAFIQAMAKSFIARHGSIVCKELLLLRAQAKDGVDNGTGPKANDRTAEYYQSRPCLSLVEDATAFACEYLNISCVIQE